MRKTLTFLGALIAMFAMSFSAQAAKVYFNNPSGWRTVKAYFYKGAANNVWPGVAMSQATGDAFYSVEVPADYEGGYVIFTNGEGEQYPAATGKQLSNVDMVCSQDMDDDTKTIWAEYNATAMEVYFDNSTENWATPYYYYWGVKEANPSAAWPGQAMTLKEGKVWKCTLPAGTCGVIFNNGAATGTLQSNNFAPKDGHTYTKTGDTAGAGAVVEDFTVYFENTSNWATPKIHYFGAGTGKESTWPGVDMTLDSGKVYKYTVPGGTTGVVFNDGAGNQTDDITVQANHLYDANSADKGVFTPGTGAQVTTPVALYLLGTVGETFWATKPGVALTKSGNTFSATNVEIKASAPGAEFGYFTLVTATGDDWDAVNSSDRFGAAAEDATLTSGTPAEMKLYAQGVDASSAKSWKLAPGKYTISADFATMKVTATLTGSGPVAGTGSLAVTPVTINPGRDANLEISIATSQKMVSLQFDVTLPERISAGAPLISRDMANHKLLYNTVNGKLRVVIYSESNEQFSAQNGAIVYLPVTAAADLAAGEYNVTLSGIAFADENLLRVASEDVIGVITVAAASDYVVTLDKTVVALQPGGTAQLSATVTPDDGTATTVSWTTSNSDVATVSPAGLVTAVANGVAVITASSKGAVATCQVYVGKQSQTITWSQNLTSLSVGESVTLNATASSNLAVTYEITNGAAYATIVDGVLRGIAPGVVTVTATQAGNDSFAPAEPVSKNVTITLGYVIGDANGDGVVTMADAVTTVDYILGNPVGEFNINAANVNGDKDASNNPIIDVVDVARIVDIVLSQNAQASPAPARDAAAGAENFSAVQDGKFLNISFSNQDAYVATLFEITLPEGAEIKSAKVMGSEHAVVMRKINDNTTRVAVYSIENENFASTGSIRLEMDTRENAVYTIDNAVVDRTDGVRADEFRANGVEGTLTGIDSINADDEAPVYYNLQGVRVENPESGLYIRVKGGETSKVLVK